MDKHIEEYLAELLPELAKRGIRVASQREIAYGIQLRLERGEDFLTLNLYYSVKKGLSKVLGNGPDTPFKKEMIELCGKSVQPRKTFHTWEHWIGSDECGKGDYFGALVVAAFAMEAGLAGELDVLGVRDSKKLRDTQIKTIARRLYERFANRIACIVVKPLKYNEIIADMKGRGHNLNDLLAWQHATAILDTFKQHPEAEGVLVDQFSPQKKVCKYLKSRELPIPVEERHGAEADLAVAAASIIARYQFLEQLEAMNRFFQMKFPLGAGRKVLQPAQDFADKYGFPRLAEVAKLHFVTSRNVMQQDIFPG
ncbi:MAG TPA: ribonuclease HIII [Candidatus Syntrophosphaera sp.]|jgi:ribonuclease HIII|nr:ribonuclease HIII [Candidatus Syntrophosphaera sp.]